MSIRIKIDTKEQTFLNYLEKDLPDIKPKLYQFLYTRCEATNLHIGDFHFYHQDFSNPILIIERKTIKDLANSIKDGRYKEQILRLKSSKTPNNRIMFIIEGCLMSFHKPFDPIQINHITDIRDIAQLEHGNKNYNGLNINALWSAFINIIVRDDIPIIETVSLLDTCKLLEKLIIQLEKKYEEIINCDGPCRVTGELENVEKHHYQYSSTIKNNKRLNMDPKMCFINQLALIPGLSVKIAVFIVNSYPSLSKLVESYQSLEETDRERMLQSMEIKLSSQKTRKLGPVLSKRIYHYLFDINLTQSS